MRRLRGLLVATAAGAYLCHVFQFFDRPFWTSGMGDWMDPYFINALLEHWHHSFWTGSDPLSPPMFFPTRTTLGYSHGLVLFAPFYLPIRLLAHPFQAYNFTLFAVALVGIVCLYLIFRRFFALSFVESFLLTAFFCTSPNVLDVSMGIWAQRASVFLVPPIVLLALASRRMKDGLTRLGLAALSGLLATLMLTQDFYTAHFAAFFLVFPAAFALFERRTAVGGALQRVWSQRGRGELPALMVVVLTVAWTLIVVASDGASLTIAGLRLRSHDWTRPALVAAVALVVFLFVRGRRRLASDVRSLAPWVWAFGAGAAAGCAVFVWIYLGAYREHRAFPESDLVSQLVPRDPARWSTPLAFLRDLVPYNSGRSFLLVVVAAALAWVPVFRVDGTTRRYWLAAVLVSTLVLAMPLSFLDVSLWRAIFEPLPGFSVIRDPKRVVYLYELAAVVAIAFLLTRTRTPAAYRIVVALVICVLIAGMRGRDVFAYRRPNAQYDHWVAAPLSIDPSCRSFFIGRAPPEYVARSPDMWTLYSIDATFVALTRSIPTLNGYSAWVPPGWDLFNPEEEVYLERVRRWIDTHALTGICELDVVARVMRPFE
jgi:hypothetical protein